MIGTRIWSGLFLVCSGLAVAADSELRHSSEIADFDRIEAILREYHPMPLRWDNVEDAPLWLQGVRPEFDRGSGLHLVRMGIGEHVMVRLPAGAWLRLHDPVRDLCPGDVEVAIGNGSGLFAVREALRSDLRRDLLYDDPTDQERVAWITRRESHCAGPKTRALALFVSRVAEGGELTWYRDEIELSAPKVRTYQARAGQFVDAYRLEPDIPVALELEGPRRLLVETRLWYPEADDGVTKPGLGRIPRNVDRYALDWLRDGAAPRRAFCGDRSDQSFEPMAFSTLQRLLQCFEPRSVWRRLRFDTTPEYTDPIAIDGQIMPTGRLERRFIDIPAGQHRFQLLASSPLLVRLRALPDSPFLLRVPNDTKPSLDAVRRVSAFPGRSFDDAFLDVLATAHRIAADNTFADGALRAAQRLFDVPVQSPYASALHAEGRRIWARHTFFREVLPDRSPPEEVACPRNPSPSFGWILPTRLAPLLRQMTMVSTAPAFLDADLAGLQEAYFTPLHPGAGAEFGSNESDATDRPSETNHGGLTYRLPERGADSQLRVSLDAPSELAEIRLWAQFDDAPPFRLFARKDAVMPDRDRLPSPAEAGLAVLQQRMGAEIWDAIALSHASAPILRPYSVELPLPFHVRRLRIWPDHGLGECVRVAVQVRTSKPYELSETEYLAAVERIPESLRLAMFSALLAPRDDLGQPLTEWRLLLAESTDRERALDRASALLPKGSASIERITIDADGVVHWQVLDAESFADPAAAREAARVLPGARAVSLPIGAESAVRRLVGTLRDSGDGIALAQHWLPLMRLLQDRASQFTAPVAPRPLLRTKSWSIQQARSQIERARARERARDWVSAAESWAELLRAAPDSIRTKALNGLVRALRHAGEAIFAERLLRGVALYEDSASMRRRARQLLLNQYRREGQDLAIEGLLAASLVRESADAGRIARALVEHFAATGEPAFALQLGLLLPKRYRPVSAMLQAALELRWGQVFEHLLMALPSEAERAYWRGHRDLRRLDWAGARRHWTKAGAVAADWLRALDVATGIGDRLAQGDPTSRPDLLRQWAAWRAKHPGPHRWRFAPEHVLAQTQVQGIEVVARGLRLTAFRASRRRPVQLQVLGPTRLKLELRPAPADPQTPISGWIQIVHNGRLRVLPYTENRAIAGLWEYARPTRPVGQAEEAVLELGPGVHRIEVFDPDRDLLVRPYEWRPILAVPVLPTRMLEPDARASKHRDSRSNFVWRDLESASWRLRMHHAGTETQLASPDLGAIHARIPGAELGDPGCPRIVAQPKGTPALPPQPPVVGSAPGCDPTEESNAASLISSRIADLWSSERHPEAATVALAEARAMRDAAVPGVAALLPRWRDKSEWELVESVDRSAGTFLETRIGWQPESPTLRVRRALLDPLPPDVAVIHHEQTTAWRFFNLDPAELRIEFVLRELPYRFVAGSRLRVVLDGRTLYDVALGPNRVSAESMISIGSGEHFLEIVPERMYADQFVIVRVLEQAANGERALVPELQRSYHVATRNEPLELTAVENTWLRIEERRAESVHTEYRVLLAGETLTLRPQAGDERALYRIFRRVLRMPESRTNDPFAVRASPIELFAPAVRPAENRSCLDCSLDFVKVRDAFVLGGQEDGTRGAGLRFITRRASEDEPEISGIDWFLELDWSHQFRDLIDGTYWRIEPFLRIRERGAPALGARGFFDWEPTDRPYSLQGSTQWIAQELPQTSPADWALTGLVRIDGQWHTRFGEQWRNTFDVGLFARWLSAEDLGSDPRIDLDVFTDYQRDHRVGCTIWDRLTHRPWMDAQWYLRVGAVCNETLHWDRLFDHAVVHAGWEQRIGSMGAIVDFRYRRLFRDLDRDFAATQRRVRLDLDWDLWTRATDRWSLGLTAAYDLSGVWNYVALRFGWNRSNGRGYLDFHRNDRPFLSLDHRDYAADWYHDEVFE